MRSYLLFSVLFIRAGLAAPRPEPAGEGSKNDDKVKIDWKGPDGNVTGQIVLSGWEKCEEEDPCSGKINTKKRDWIVGGLDDMIEMTPGTKVGMPDVPEFDPSVWYQVAWKNAPAMEFLGPKSRSGKWREKMHDNFDNIAGVTNSRFFGTDVHVRCDDPANECSKGTQAYTMHGGGMDDQINFCPEYFGQKKLADAIKDASSNEAKADHIFMYLNRATTWAHELMHISWMGKLVGKNDAWMKDYLYPENAARKWKQYRAIDCKWLAFSDATPDNSMANNPQNYAYLMLAQYVTSKIGFYPSRPVWNTKNDPPSPPGASEAQTTDGWDPELGGDPRCPISNDMTNEAPRDLKCLEKEWSADKKNTNDGSKSVEDAIKEFCKNRKGQSVKKGDDRIYDRWDVSGWGISKRQSMWLSAKAGPFDACKEGKIEDDCVKVLTGGMKNCDKDKPRSHGMVAQGGGCIEYAIDFSASVHEGDPPWNQHVIKYPPPEDAKSRLPPASLDGPQIVCSKEKGAQWKKEDADRLIEEYCGNDEPSLEYAPKPDDAKLWISAGFEDKKGGPYPDDKKGYCKDFPHKEKKSKDDCRYAFRKIFNTKLSDHAFCMTYYRCIGYMVVAGDFSDPLAVEKRQVLEGPGSPENNGNTNNSMAAELERLGFQL